MFFKSQKSMDSFTIRSIDIRNSSNTISQENQTMKKIEENCLNNLATLIPTQQRRKSIRSFATKDPDPLLSQNSTKPKPYPSAKDNEAEQEVGFIENYLGSHKKYKTYFKSKRYKKIYQQLSKKLPLQKSYFCLYMKDKFYALNKHIKVSLVHKETSFQDYLGPYFDAGKKIIKQFYKYFLVDDMLYIGTKKVNPNLIVGGSFAKPSNVCQFLYFIVTFLYQIAIFYRSKNQRKQAQTYYEANLKITHKILQSSTSVNLFLLQNSSLRRKISQYLISFSSFLIENRQLVKAIKILEMALQNCINLIAIVQTKLKYCFKGKHPNNEKDISLERFKKRTNSKLKEAFQLMMAIYLNSAVVFELQNKEYLSYVALNQVRYIEQILYKNWSIKIRIPELIKKPKEAFEYQHEKIHIIKCYFDMKAILKKQKQQKELEYNQNVAICGLTKSTQASVIQNKDLMELFFDEEKKKKLKIERKKMSVITKKIGLIEYDNNQNQNQYQNKSIKEEPTQSTFKYTINMKTINGGQETAVYNSVQPAKDQPIEANKLSPEVVVVRRGKKKLSNFYNLAMSQKQISLRESTNNRIDINSNQEIKKSEKTTSTLKSQKTVVPLPAPPSVIKESKLQEKKTDFLDELINSQIEIKRYFLYGKDFVDKYDLLSKGKTLYSKKDKEKREPYQKDFYNDFQDGKRIQYQTKNEIQILSLKNKNTKTVSHHTSSTTLLHKKNRPQLRHPFNCLLNQNHSQKQPVYIVCNQNQKQHDNFSTKENQLKNQNLKKIAAKSLKFEPMSYNEVMEKIKKTQIQFIKKDYNEKNHIYRLKCKSQNISRSKFDLTQMSNDLFNKSANPDTIANSLKKQKQSEAIASKFQSTEKSKNFLKEEVKKGGKLTKKTVNSNMFSSAQTGIRLLKKIIFKHKKTLKINKTDLFVNYNKTEVREQEIKLVDRQSFLMVQYNMCQEETKARIKQNMRLLIVDNIRNSEENQKRVQKLNKAITAYDKNRRVNQFSVKMKRQYDGRNHLGAENFILAHNPQYFAQTFANKNQRRDSQTSETDQMLRKIFQKRILDSKGDNESLGPKSGSGQEGDHEFLKKCKVKNPNLFLSSIQYKDEDEGFKKMKSVKNGNKGQKQNKLMDDIDEDEGQEKHKKQAIQKFLQLFKCNRLEEDQSEHDSKNGKDEEN